MPDVCRTVQNELRLLSGQAIYVTPPILTAIFFLLNLRPRGPDYPWLRPGRPVKRSIVVCDAELSRRAECSGTRRWFRSLRPEAVGGTYPAKPCCFAGSCFPPM